MDQTTQERLDRILEDEIRLGYRIKAIPEAMRHTVTAVGGPDLERVRLTRLNPGKRRKIASVVQRQYHRDLQDSTILSHDQVLRLVQDRGEWSPEMDAEMKSLQETVNRDMTTLFLDGTAEQEWGQQLLKASSNFRTRVNEALPEDKREAVLSRFDRWLEFTPERQDEYTEKYAQAENRARYSPDADLQRLMDAVPDPVAVADLHTLDDLRDRMHRYLALQRKRLRLSELQLRYNKIFADTVEQRRDTAEEMARVYFSIERVDEDGTPLGPLAKEFEDLWDWPEDVVRWLMVETYFFQNGIPDEARDYLQTFGFLEADEEKTTPSESGESGPSDASLDPQTSRPDSEAVEVAASSSSV